MTITEYKRIKRRSAYLRRQNAKAATEWRRNYLKLFEDIAAHDPDPEFRALATRIIGRSYGERYAV